MHKLQGIARVTVRGKVAPGVVAGVRALGYHPWAFNGNDGRGRSDWHRRIRAEYARSHGR